MPHVYFISELQNKYMIVLDVSPECVLLCFKLADNIHSGYGHGNFMFEI